MNVFIGVSLLARGRARGLAAFPNTRQAFLSSLAPLLAFPIVGSLLLVLRGGGLAGITEFLETIAVLLTPPVLSFEFARLWGRERNWLRFATAFGWCQWAVPVVAAVMMLAFAAMILLGLPSAYAAVLVVVVLAGYGLWLHWFLVRRGLELSSLRAAMVVIAMNIATVLIVLGIPNLARVADGG